MFIYHTLCHSFITRCSNSIGRWFILAPLYKNVLWLCVPKYSPSLEFRRAVSIHAWEIYSQSLDTTQNKRWLNTPLQVCNSQNPNVCWVVQLKGFLIKYFTLSQKLNIYQNELIVATNVITPLVYCCHKWQILLLKLSLLHSSGPCTFILGPLIAKLLQTEPSVSRN